VSCGGVDPPFHALTIMSDMISYFGEIAGFDDIVANLAHHKTTQKYKLE
jgi:hypothetical protein